MTVLLTFDIEEWHHANYAAMGSFNPPGKPSNLEDLTGRIIALCDEYRVKATCFILGSVAREKPGVVRALSRAGHEIASHGYDHQPVYTLSPDQFRTDLARSRACLEDLAAGPVLGYRAPSWSVQAENLVWFYEHLAEEGFRYSSSVYPARTFLYGIPGHTREAHQPRSDGRSWPLVEIPVPVVDLGPWTAGFSGGFFFRAWPAFLIRRALAHLTARGQAPFIYLHPRELDPGQPRLKLPPVESLIHYYGIAGCERKLRRLLAALAPEISTVARYLAERGLPGGDAG